MNDTEEVTVNVADWDGPPLDGFGWDDVRIVNAPRPIAGEWTWTGHFRHGVFYAAAAGDRLAASWKADDAWPVVFTTNAAIEAVVQAKLDDCGITLEEAGWTMAELAGQMGLPYYEEVTP